MNCPNCQTEMSQGRYKLQGTIWGFMLLGFSQKELYFVKGKQKEKTLGLRDFKKGFYCNKCQTQVILNN